MESSAKKRPAPPHKQKSAQKKLRRSVAAPAKPLERIGKGKHQELPEKLLQASEEKYRRLFEAAQDGILILDADTGVITEVNPFLEKMLGYTRAEMIGKKLWRMGPFKDIAASRAAFQSLQKKKYIRYENLPLEAKDGHVCQVEFVSNVYRAGGQKVIQCNVRDNTDRFREEEERNSVARLYRQLTEQAAEGIFTVDPQGKFILVNPETCRMLGYTEKEILQLNILDTYPPEQKKEGKKRLAALRAGERLRFERLALRKDGSVFWIGVSAAVLEHGNLQAIIHDITERKQAENALRESEDKFKFIFEYSTVGKSVTQVSGEVEVNQAFARMLGYTPEELYSKKWRDFTHPDDIETNQKIIDSILSGEQDTIRWEKRYLHKSGAIVWADISTSLRRDNAGTPLYFMTSALDITERKYMEKTLLASEAKYRGLFENSLEGIGLSRGNQVISANRALLDIFGYQDLQEFLAVPLLETVAPESRDLVVQIMQKMDSGQIPEAHFFYKIIRKDGNIRDIEISVEKIKLVDEIYNQSTFRDVTDRMQVEEALKESEERLHRLTQVTFEAIVIHDAGKIVDVNPALLEMFGCELPDVIGENVLKFVAPESREKIIKSLASPSDKLTEANGIRKDGTVFPLEVLGKAFPVQGSTLRVTALHDITKRKQAEVQLEQERNLLRTLIDNLPDAIYAKNVESQFILGNNAVAHVMGAVSSDDLIGKTDFDFYPKKLAKQYIADDQQVIRSGKAVVNREEPIIYQDGTQGWVLTTKVPLFDQHGSVTGIVGIGRTITERRQAQEALRTSEEKYRTLVNDLNDGFYIADIHGVLTYANQSLAQSLGYKNSKQLLGKRIFEFLSPEQAKVIQDRYQAAMQAGEALGTFVAEIVRQNGSRAYLEIKPQVILDAGRPVGDRGIITDITERRQAQILQDAVYQIALAAESSPTLDELYPRIHQIISAVMPAENFFITLYDENRNLLRFPYIRDVADEPYIDELDPGKGLTAYILRTGRSLLCDEALHHKLEQQGEVKLLGVLSKIWLGVPLIINGKTIGAVVVQHYTDPNAYTDRELHILEFVSSQVASAITRKQAELDLKNRADEFSVLYSTAQSLASVTDQQAILQTVLDQAVNLLNTTNGTIALYDVQRGDLELVAEKEFPAPLGARTKMGEGMSGQVAQTRQPLYVEDYQTWEQRIHRLDAINLNAAIEVPLIYHGRLLGTLGVGETDSDRKFKESDVRLLTLFAAQAASAIQNSHLHIQTERRLAELEAVNQISTALRGARTVDEMLPRLLDETLKLVGTSVGDIWLLDPNQGRLRQTISRGRLIGAGEKNYSPGEGIAGYVLKTGEPYTSPELIRDAKVDLAAAPDIPAGWGGICVPIRAEQDTIGVLCIYVEVPRQLGQEDVNLLTTISEIAGNAIRRIRLFEETLHQVQRLAALRSMDTAISSVLDLRMVLDILLGHIVNLLAVDAADVLLLNTPTHTLDFVAGHGFRTSGIQLSHLRLDEGYAGRVAREKTLVNVRNLPERKKEFLRQPLLEGEAFIEYFGVPLISKGQIRGVLEIFHRSSLNPDADWLGFLETLAGQAAIAVDNSQMFENLQNSNYEMMLAYDETIEGWSQAMDMRDKETEGHSQRVTGLTVRLAEDLGFTPEELIHIRRGALLHDIGKLGVPDEVLRKTGPLNDEDWVHMRKHPQLAHDMLAPIRYLHPALDIPYCHHEKWDGSGYPRGLKGDQIPLAARIFAVVDVWDALTSDRPYRKAWTREKTLDYIREQAGIFFDPMVVDLFMREVESSGK